MSACLQQLNDPRRIFLSLAVRRLNAKKFENCSSTVQKIVLQYESYTTLHCNVTTEAYACTTFGTAKVKYHIHQTKEVLMMLS